MSLKKFLLDGATVLSERNKGKILQGLISDVKSAGLQITFTGEYRQRLNDKSVMPVPFVVIQNVDQYTDMPDGILSGVIYEQMRTANIVGSISPKRIDFDKKYKEIPKEEKKLLPSVRKLLFPKDKGKPLMNRNTIRYEGISKDKGMFYDGTWKFDSKTAEFDTRGTFIMQRYTPTKKE